MQTERTILKLLTRDDFTEVLVMYDEPDTFKYIEPLQNKTRDEYISFLETRIAQINDDKGYHWAVRLKENNKFIGLMNLNPIRDTDRMQIGFQLRRKYWNRGFATELTRRVMDFATEDLGLKVLYGVFNKQNVASYRVFQKLGFEFDENRADNRNEEPLEIWKYIAKHKITAK